MRYARTLFDVVEFSPEDATRTELDFLLEVVQTAVNAGASYINIPDTVGFTTPSEYGHIFKYLIENVKADHPVIFSPHCHNDLGMAVANTLAAVKNGARRVEGTINGIGERAGNAALEEVAVALSIRDTFYQLSSPIKLQGTTVLSEMVAQFSGVPIPKNKAVVGGNAFSHESGIHQDGVLKNPLTYEIISPELVGHKQQSLPLGKLSGRHAFVERLRALQFELEDEEITRIFTRFKALADKKQTITDTDITALVVGGEVENRDGFHFYDLKLSSEGDHLSAQVTLQNQNQETVTLTADGQGSVEAIFNAIDTFFHQQVILDSYTLDGITEGIDAQARVSVSVRNQDTDNIFNASGLDFDVLKASAKAYVNANLLVQKENQGELPMRLSEKQSSSETV